MNLYVYINIQNVYVITGYSFNNRFFNQFGIAFSLTKIRRIIFCDTFQFLTSYTFTIKQEILKAIDTR